MSTAKFRGDCHRPVTDLAQRLRGNPEIGASLMARRIVDNAVTEIPGAGSAGIALATPSHVRTEAATDDIPTALDLLQGFLRQGPNMSAATDHTRHHVVRVDDLAGERRWPQFCSEAAEFTPIRSMLSVRLFATSREIAALNLYADTPRAFSHEAESIARQFATEAARAWYAARRTDRLRQVRETRATIAQATAVLMTRFDIDRAAASKLLDKLAAPSDSLAGVVGAGPDDTARNAS